MYKEERLGSAARESKGMEETIHINRSHSPSSSEERCIYLPTYHMMIAAVVEKEQEQVHDTAVAAAAETVVVVQQLEQPSSFVVVEQLVAVGCVFDDDKVGK